MLGCYERICWYWPKYWYWLRCWYWPKSGPKAPVFSAFVCPANIDGARTWVWPWSSHKSALSIMIQIFQQISLWNATNLWEGIQIPIFCLRKEIFHIWNKNLILTVLQPQATIQATIWFLQWSNDENPPPYSIVVLSSIPKPERIQKIASSIHWHEQEHDDVDCGDRYDWDQELFHLNYFPLSHSFGLQSSASIWPPCIPSCIAFHYIVHNCIKHHTPFCPTECWCWFGVDRYLSWWREGWVTWAKVYHNSRKSWVTWRGWVTWREVEWLQERLCDSRRGHVTLTEKISFW